MPPFFITTHRIESLSAIEIECGNLEKSLIKGGPLIIFHKIVPCSKSGVKSFPKGFRMEATDFRNLHKISVPTVYNMFIFKFIPR